MGMGTVQLFDDTLHNLLDGTDPTSWEANDYYASLYTANGANLPSDAWNTRNDVTGITEVSEAGDYDQKDVGTPLVGGTPPQVEFASSIINWGSDVSITAKWLIVFQGDEASPTTGDACVFWCNCYDGDTTTEVSSTNSDFTIDDSANGWFYIAAQAA